MGLLVEVKMKNLRKTLLVALLGLLTTNHLSGIIIHATKWTVDDMNVFCLGDHHIDHPQTEQQAQATIEKFQHCENAKMLVERNNSLQQLWDQSKAANCDVVNIETRNTIIKASQRKRPNILTPQQAQKILNTWNTMKEAIDKVSNEIIKNFCQTMVNNFESPQKNELFQRLEKIASQKEKKQYSRIHLRTKAFTWPDIMIAIEIDKALQEGCENLIICAGFCHFLGWHDENIHTVGIYSLLTKMPNEIGETQIKENIENLTPTNIDHFYKNSPPINLYDFFELPQPTTAQEKEEEEEEGEQPLEQKSPSFFSLSNPYMYVAAVGAVAIVSYFGPRLWRWWQQK